MIIELALGLCFGVLLAVRLISLMIRANKEGKPYHTNVDSDATVAPLQAPSLLSVTVTRGPGESLGQMSESGQIYF